MTTHQLLVSVFASHESRVTSHGFLDVGFWILNDQSPPFPVPGPWSLLLSVHPMLSAVPRAVEPKTLINRR